MCDAQTGGGSQPPPALRDPAEIPFAGNRMVTLETSAVPLAAPEPIGWRSRNHFTPAL